MSNSAEQLIDNAARVDDATRQIIEQDDFLPLVRALTRAEDFALYFVECNVPTFRRKVAEAVRDRVDRPVVDVDLGNVDRSPTRPSIDYTLEQRLSEVAANAAVFVWNLEHLLPSTRADRDVTEQTLTEVNWRRSAFTRLERPLVIWLPEYAIRYLARNAPDFFDWNSGLYRFQAPADERPALLEESLQQIGGYDIIKNLSTSAKRETEAHLKSLLDEYTEDTAFDRTTRGELLHRLAYLHAIRDSYAQARKQFQEALQIWQQVENRAGEAAARHQLATIALRQGEYEWARSEFEKALEIQQEIENRGGEAATRHQIATVAMNQGQYERARSEFEKAFEIRQEIRDRSGEAATRHQLATISLEQEGHERAQIEFEDTLGILQEIGDRAGEAATRHNLASIALRQGAYEQAQTEFESALKTRQEIGDRAGEAATRHNLASIALEQGEYERARNEFEKSLAIKQEIRDQSGEAATWHQLATIALEQGKYERAQTEFEDALEIRQEIGDESGEAATWAQLGILAADCMNRKSEGLCLLIVSHKMFEEIGATQVDQVEPWINSIASELEYDQEAFNKQVETAISSYQQDQGQSLLRGAFPEAATPANE